MNEVFLGIKATLEACFTVQTNAVEVWHRSGHEHARAEDLYSDASIAGEFGPDDSISTANLLQLVIKEHFYNFSLWHAESYASCEHVEDSVLADCKRRIDELKPQRLECIEQIDKCLVGLFQPIIPEKVERNKYNTETLGMALDRLSIMTIQMFHMAEDSTKRDLTPSQSVLCEDLLAALHEQWGDLKSAVLDLVDEYGKGLKTPKFYRQIEGCNTPDLSF